jgi:hypothetical protein
VGLLPYLVVAGFSVLIDIEAFFLNALVDAQTMQFLDAIEESEATNCSPEVDNEDTEALCSEESPTMTIEGAVAG